VKQRFINKVSKKPKILIHDKYVLLLVEGKALPKHEIEPILQDAIETAVNSNLAIIIYRETPYNQLITVIDLYYLVDLMHDGRFRGNLAIVFPDEIYENMSFFETTARNRGFNVRLFSQMQDALKWIDNNK